MKEVEDRGVCDLVEGVICVVFWGRSELGELAWLGGDEGRESGGVGLRRVFCIVVIILGFILFKVVLSGRGTF